MDQDATGASWRPAVAASLLAAATYRARFGYAFGFSDQDEFLPWLVHRLEPATLSGDWFVGVQSSGFNVRSGFMAVLEPIADTIGIEPAIDLLYVVCWALLGLSVFGVMVAFSRSAAAATVGTIAVLALLPRWTLGGNAMSATMLVPSMLAWSLCMASLTFHIRGSRLLSGLLLGLSFWIQPVVVIAAAVPMTLATVVRHGMRPTELARGIRDASLLLGPFVVLALPAIVLLFLNRMAPVAAGPSFADLLTRFRAPHHYLPGAFPLSDWIQFVVLAGVGLAALRGLTRRRKPVTPHYASALLVGAGLLLLVGFAGTAVDSLALLQPFKVTVFAGVVLTALLAGDAAGRLRSFRPGMLRLLDRTASHGITIAASAALLAVVILVVPVRSEADVGIAGAADWLREHSPSEAIVAVPPSTTGFRYRARRAVVVTFKAVPFTPSDLAAWYRRLMDMAPGFHRPDPADGAAVMLDSLDTAYERAGAAYLDGVVRRHSVSYVVRRTPLSPAAPAFEPVFRSGTVYVYQHLAEDAP